MLENNHKIRLLYELPKHKLHTDEKETFQVGESNYSGKIINP